ncbi:hypothetical protein NUW58_g2779 [Xylaria curta]|nr:hypothetical protein NUW58_g2779 [Xylaria curta]
MPPNRNVSTPTTISPPVTSQDIESRPTQTPSPHLQLDSTTQRPGPVRHYTEETTSSTASDDSLSRTRRSALRRSSSASIKDIQSPRRVRFDVEGEEVLPTVSPPTPSLNCSIHDLPTSPQSEEQVIPAHGPLNHEVFEDETTILGNSPPGPKKISSTERLKALARSSTEDTSKWTLVGDIHDDDEEEEGIIMLSSKKKPIAPVPELIAATAFENGAGPHYTQDNSPKEIAKEIRHDENTDEAVDDLLGLTPLSSFKDKKRFSPPQEAQKVVQEVSPDADLESQRVLSQSSGPSDPVLISQSKDQNYEEEAMFSFDDDEPALQPQTINITPEHEEQEEIEVHETSTPWTDNLAEKVPVSLYSTSPAISAARPASLRATSPASSLSKRMSASAGSYKGKPFLIGVVRDEELHKRAAEMGDLLHFVGSVDGRSGVDPSDSYHQAPYYSHGTPRSLGERLMEENAHRIANNALRRD